MLSVRTNRPPVVFWVFVATVVGGAAHPCLGWDNESTHAGITYLLRKSPPRIDRFDLAAGRFLSPILPETGVRPDTFVVGKNGIFYAEGTDVFRVDHDGANSRHLATLSDIVDDLVSEGSFLFASAWSTFWSLDPEAGTVRSSFRGRMIRYPGLSVAPSLRRVFGNRQGSPPDLVRVDYHPDGTLADEGDSPYHGELLRAFRTWVTPDERFVIADSGSVHATADMTIAGSLGLPITDLDFDGSRVVASRGSTLFIYDENFAENGQFELAREPRFIVVHGGKAHAFFANEEVEVVPLEHLVPPAPDEPVGPEGLAFTPDEILAASDGSVVFLLSSVHRTVFRWRPDQDGYDTGIGLVGPAAHMTWSPERERLYVIYDAGQLVEIDPTSPLAQRPIAGVRPGSRHLAAIDPFLLVVGAEFLELFDAGGEQLQAESQSASAASAVAWDPITRRLFSVGYHYRVTAETVSIDGEFGVDRTRSLTAGHYPPIRLSPDGQMLLVGGGDLLDADSFQVVAALGFAPADATWHDGSLHTLRQEGEDALVQRWNGDPLAASGLLRVAGEPQRMFSLGDSLLVITLVDGVPAFTIGRVGADGDDDGIADGQDNCPGVPNPDQSDVDGDLVGDLCDPYPADRDDDGIAAEIDNCPEIGNPGQEDRDHDAIGDVCDRYPDAFDHLQACFDESAGRDATIADLAFEVDRLGRENADLRARIVSCAGDVDLDGNVTVDEIVLSITRALHGCPPQP